MSDYMIRATAADLYVRAFAICSTDLVEEARKHHHTTPVMTAALGRLLSGGVMMGAMMKNEKDILTIRIKGDGPGEGLMVTADNHGNVKGFPYNPEVIIPLKRRGKLDVGGAIGNGILQVTRDVGMKEPYSGQCLLQTGEIAEDLCYYFTTSEQTPSAVGLGVLVDRDRTVKQAGGFIIQLMPGASEEVIAKIEENTAAVSSVTDMMEEGLSPEDILTRLLDGLDPVINDRMDVRFFCDCSREKISSVLATLKDSDLVEMIRDNEPVEVRCDFCNTAYSFSPVELLEIRKKRIVQESEQ